MQSIRRLLALAGAEGIRFQEGSPLQRMSVPFLLTLVLVCGCSDQPQKIEDGLQAVKTGDRRSGGPEIDRSENSSDRKHAPDTERKTILPDWNSPAAVLLMTGEQHGYFEPCGCSIHQLGGMARRADLVRILTEERKWPVGGLDVGGTVRRNRRQDQIKFLTLFEAFRKLKYGVVAVGLEELKLGADFLLQQQVVDPAEAQRAVGIVGANVVLYDPPLEGWPLQSRIVQVGSVKIGVTAIVGQSLRDEVAPLGVMNNILVIDPVDAIPQALAALKVETPDVLILLSHGQPEEAKQLAEKFPEFQIVLTAGGPEEADKTPVVVGNTWILQAGHKGKRVGVLGYFPDSQTERFRYDLIDLDDQRFENAPAMRELMKTYQQQLQDEEISTSDELLFKHPSGHAFVGADKCGECHTKAFNVWKSTPHAKAFKTLISGREGAVDPLSRIHDPECLSCHVTGWEPQQMLRYDTGFMSQQITPHLLNQQCENCHGPGSDHVRQQEKFASDESSVTLEELKSGQATVRRTLAQAKSGDCAKCHDSDNDPKFTPDAFDQYWEKVKHPERD